jgi:hypothetical protein
VQSKRSRLGVLPRSQGLALALWIALCPAPAVAEIVKEVTIDSVPPGAQVYLLQGGKRTLLGSTPISPPLEFHSEISVLRLSVSKNGFENEAAEVGARDSNLTVRLRRQRIAADPSQLSGQARDIQQRIAQQIEEVMRPLIGDPESGLHLTGQMRAVRLDGKNYLFVPAALSGSQPEQASARSVWSQLRAKWIESLAAICRHDVSINGAVIDVRLEAISRTFAVASKVESRLEMECVAGTEHIQVYEPCVRQVERSEWSASGRESRRLVCEGGLVSRPVFNSCLTRAPVTRSDVVISPEAGTKGDRVRKATVSESSTSSQPTA